MNYHFSGAKRLIYLLFSVLLVLICKYCVFQSIWTINTLTLLGYLKPNKTKVVF